MAPEGYVIHACDFSFAELCTLAQTCLKNHGKSVLADVINSGTDPHTFMGGQIKEKATTVGSLTDKQFRNMAKPVNFYGTITYNSNVS